MLWALQGVGIRPCCHQGLREEEEHSLKDQTESLLDATLQGRASNLDPWP